MQLHGMSWLDDLFATEDAETVAAPWVSDWIARFGTGAGPGWMPALVGRRLLRWIDRGAALQDAMDPAERRAFLAACYAHAAMLASGWSEAPGGLPRVEALAGRTLATLSLEGLEERRRGAIDALDALLAEELDRSGGLAVRNPEALLETAALTARVLDAMEADGEPVPPGLADADSRMRAALLTLRHSDGALPRFQGGGRGRPERIGRVIPAPAPDTIGDGGRQAMGFARLAAAGVSVIVDAARPPAGEVSGSAHASTLAFEMSSGDHPLIVNCGPGGAFGPDWHRAGRLTASHSVLTVEDRSSAAIGAPIALGTRRIAPLVAGPERVTAQLGRGRGATTLALAHDGYAASHGLTHLRRLQLSSDGRSLLGEDALRADGVAAKERFEDASAEAGGRGIPFAIRFHLHPAAEAALDMGGRAISIALPTGEIWLLRTRSAVATRIEESVHLEPSAARPVAASQVVLSDRCVKYAATVDWSLTRV
jgi:uncharacterized heparinase superfamily protein